MAADAATPPVPGPADPPDTALPAGRSSGMFASMLAPVEPARPTFDLTPTAGPAASTDTPVAEVSSASYHGGDEASQRSETAARAGEKKSVWRAWLLAGAARWGKGGGAQNKRLDLAKVKAQARQVKETRNVAVNRSGGIPGKAPAAPAPGGKSLGSKQSKPDQVKGPKNHSGSLRQGPSGPSGGSSGSGTRGSSREPAGGKDNGTSRKITKGDEGRHTPKTAKGDEAKNGTPGGGKNGAPGSAGSAGKNGTSGPDRTGASTGSTTGRKNGNSPGTQGASGGKDGTQPNSTTGKKPASADGTGPSGKPGKPAPHTPPGSPGPASKDRKPGQPQPQDGEPTGQQGGKPFSTRESREAGYRDGTRAARTAAHVRAYRDGAKDGWSDTTEAAEREKDRLDKAHQDRKNERDEEQTVSGERTSADYHQPQPVGVKGVNGTHVLLGDGAAKDSMTRGEVRSLKTFERRLEAKSASMTKVGEATKGLKAHADQQAKKATRLLEAAKAVKGGEKLAAALTKLQEAASNQAGKADEIQQQAVRAAEGCGTVLSNVGTRYGGIYKAVVDSDETAPAELDFYKG